MNLPILKAVVPNWAATAPQAVTWLNGDSPPLGALLWGWNCGICCRL